MNFSFCNISWLLLPRSYFAQERDYFFPPALSFLRGFNRKLFPLSVSDKFLAPICRR
jgi:hypothetical protein